MSMSILKRIMCLMGAKADDTRPYKEVLKSITLSGTQYFDLGERSITNTGKFKIRFKKGNISSARFLTGDNPNSSTSHSLCMWATQTTIVVQNGGNTRVNLALANNVDADLEIHPNKYVLNGTATAITQVSEFSQTMDLYVGWATSDALDRYFIGSVSLYQHWDADGVKDIDIIPVLDWNDQPCIYDRVAEELIYANTQTGLTYERWNMIEVEYIRGNGNQYIDTGYRPRDTMDFKAELDLALNSASVTTYTGENNGYWFGTSGGDWTIGGGVSISGADTDRHDITLTSNRTSATIGSIQLTVDNRQSSIRAYTQYDTYDGSYYLFKINNYSGSMPCKMYSAKLYGDNILVREYQPCVIDSTGYMYDRVENKIYGNEGTGAFTYPLRQIYAGVGSSSQTGTPTPTNPIPVISTTYYDENGNSVELRKVGTYEDSYSNGVITRNVGVKVFDGTESFSASGYLGNCWTYTTHLDSDTSFTDRTVLCTHFRNSSTLPSVENRQGYALLSKTSSGKFVGFGATTAYTTASEFKSWVAEQYANGTPLTAYYPLATPTTESKTLYEIEPA